MSDSENNPNNDTTESRQVLESLEPTCNELKYAYDACFNEWFTGTFLKGGHKGKGTPCDDLLEVYSACVKAALQAKKIELDELAEMEQKQSTVPGSSKGTTNK